MSQNFRHFYWSFFALILAIALFGLFFLYSASYNMDVGGEYYAMRQLIRIAVGLVVFLTVLGLGYKTFLNLSYVIYLLVSVLLVLVLVVAPQKFGVHRWLDIGPLTIQPSEFSKLAVILVLAQYLGRRKENLYQINRFFMAFLLTLGPLILVLKEPDLGTSLIFFPVLFCMLYVWGAKLKYFITTALLGLSAAPFFWLMLKPYQKRRLLSFIDPNNDPLGASYTVNQSKIAIGSGGWLGKGWLAGSQNKLNFVPEHHTDFIFSVVGEEGGFLTVVAFFLLFILMLRLCFMAIRQTTDMSGRLLVTGIIAMLFFHVVVNVGMTIGMMPVTGLPLPLISYGGSSVLTFFISFGLVVSVYRERSIF